MLTFGSKLNRSYTLHLPFQNDYADISILFNKANTFIGVNTGKVIYEASRNHELHSHIYKNVNESVFASTFLDLKNFKSQNLDIINQFNNIQKKFKSKVQYVTNETIKLSKIMTDNGKFESSLYIYVFGIMDYGRDFIFILAERQHIDAALGRKIVRSIGLQLCSNSRYDDLLQTIDYYNTKELSSDTVDHTMNNIFSKKKKNVNERLI